jgi:hypothetical protein
VAWSFQGLERYLFLTKTVLCVSHCPKTKAFVFAMNQGLKCKYLGELFPKAPEI